MLEDYRALAKVLDALLSEIEAEIRPGTKTSRFNAITEDFIRATGLESSFKGYRGFPAYVTASINEEVLNALPSDRKLAEGDLFKIQAGIKDGVGHSYQAWTYFVGQPRLQDEKFVTAGLDALDRATRQARTGGDVVDIARAIQTTIEGAGYSVNRKYVGHGMGSQQHENPQVPCYVVEPVSLMAHRLRKGQLLSIQVIAHAGREDSRTLPDHWGVVTRDRSRALTLSQIVAVDDGGPEVLTPPRNCLTSGPPASRPS